MHCTDTKQEKISTARSNAYTYRLAKISNLRELEKKGYSIPLYDLSLRSVKCMLYVTTKIKQL